MIHLPFIAVGTLLQIAPIEPGPEPTGPELREMMAEHWGTVQGLIQSQDRLEDRPATLVGVTDHICRPHPQFRTAFECVVLIEFRFGDGTSSSTLLRHHAVRDLEGEFGLAILGIAEAPR